MGHEPQNVAAPISGFPGVPHGDGEMQHKTRQISAANVDPPSSSSGLKHGHMGNAEAPPVYTIDLSLQPAERYVQLAIDFKDQLQDVAGLFAEVVVMIGLPLALVRFLARIFLRRVYSKEQTEEIRSIARVAGLEMYLAVSFNTVLDLLMGCTSGGVRVKSNSNTKMLHFRTLDWGMDTLRKTIVQLEFVEKPGGPVIARTVTYVGFVGVLTGIRQDLSMSLNFRPYHNNHSLKIANLKFYGHLLLVLLGFRPSIAAILRDVLIPPARRNGYCVTMSEGSTNGPLPSLDDTTHCLPSIPSTAAYLIFSDGTKTTVLEKDRKSASIYSSIEFIVATNHDSSDERNPEHSYSHKALHAALGMAELVAESQDRKGCIVEKWQKAAERYKKRNPGRSEEGVSVSVDTVKRWVQTYPVTNEETHYSCIMDPKSARFTWVRKFDVSEQT